MVHPYPLQAAPAYSLQGLVTPSRQASHAYGLNDGGQVVGTSGDADGRPRAFLWSHGRMRDLNGLIPPCSGWVLEEARGINAHGQIVGWGLFHGLERAFPLTPR